jgi:hypothetical protein
MPDSKFTSGVPDPLTLTETEALAQAGQPAVDPTLQVRFLQILAEKVVESLRTQSRCAPPSSN